MNGLQRLNDSGYRCIGEIDACLTMIRAEFAANTSFEVRIESAREALKIQGYVGNWNYDEYMHGMYNGMELILATIEGRKPEYREAPAEFIAPHASKVSAELDGKSVEGRIS